MTTMGKLGVSAVVLLASLYAAIVPTRGPESEQMGYRVGTFIAAMLFPYLIAYVIAGRQKVRDWKRFAYVFSIAGLSFLTLSALGATNALNVETPEQHIGRLMREAAGNQPVRNTGFGKQSALDDAFREHFRNLIRLNQEYTAAAKQLNVSETDKLNSPETLSNPDLAEEALKQLHAAYDLDASEEKKVTEIIDSLRQAIRSSSSSPAMQQSMLNGFDKGVASQLSKRQRVVSTEKGWVEAEDDLYAFAGQYRKQIKLTGSKLAIADEGVRKQFNEKVRSEEASRKDFLETKHQFSNDQVKLLGSYGVDQKTVGLQ